MGDIRHPVTSSSVKAEQFIGNEAREQEVEEEEERRRVCKRREASAVGRAYAGEPEHINWPTNNPHVLTSAKGATERRTNEWTDRRAHRHH